MTPAQAIVSATRNGAAACKGLREFGTIENGKRADLLLLDANPLEDISNIRKLSLVMTGGRIIDTDKLPEKPVYYRR
jgi:imidazolonepropionase-like amidohydrolase